MTFICYYYILLMGDNMECRYISERLDGQMKYYKNRCKSLKYEYYTLSIIVIIATAIIPIFTIAVDAISILKYVVAALSAIATILNSILLLRKTKEKWTEYRVTYEQLKHEKTMFTSGVGKYCNGDECAFIEACENIMCSEHKVWYDLMKSSSKAQ